jgi:5'-deoxynucleotidase YfbR-like HD superfamily hydrolase
MAVGLTPATSSTPSVLDKSFVRHGWEVCLFNGRFVDVRNVTDEDIDIDSIAQSLSLQCRYMGHIRHHYSVAQHLCYVSDMVTLELGCKCRASFAGLIHDFPEGMLHDLVRGIKVGISDETDAYQEADAAIMARIARLSGLDNYDDYHDIVKKWDNRVLKSEVLSLANQTHGWLDVLKDIEPAPLELDPWSPAWAKEKLLKKYYEFVDLIKKGLI